MKKTLINKELLYKGNWDDFCSNPQGIVIRKGDELTLYKNNNK